jgi:O-antigen/teichoic acid export membrane protein
MAFKRNIFANYLGQIYTISIGIIVTPLYLQYLGAEPYGLIGIFALMQACMFMLDLGISPTLGRQAAVFRGQQEKLADFWILIKSFEVLFLGFAFLTISIIFVASNWIAGDWINVSSLEMSTVISCLQIMGLLLGLRFFASLYRSGISGLEDQVWLNAFNIIIISLKMLGGLLLVANFSIEIIHFFIYQLAIGFIEVAVLMRRFYAGIKKPAHEKYIRFDWIAIKSIRTYAISIAYTSILWTLTTQTDKLIFSKVLSLTEFGYFSLVALAAGGIVLINNPVIQALMPRMTYLYAEGDKNGLIKIYRNSSQLTALLVLCTAGIFGLYAQEILYAWTGDKVMAAWGSEVLLWFSLGNAVMLLGAYPYYMQQATGKLKWHIIGSSIMVVIQVPLIYWTSMNYGPVIAGKAWFAFLTLWFFIWTPLVHRKLIPGFHLKWLIHDIAPVFTVVLIVIWVCRIIFKISENSSRLVLLFEVALSGTIILIVSSLSTRLVRDQLSKWWINRVMNNK